MKRHFISGSCRTREQHQWDLNPTFWSLEVDDSSTGWLLNRHIDHFGTQQLATDERIGQKIPRDGDIGYQAPIMLQATANGEGVQVQAVWIREARPQYWGGQHVNWSTGVAFIAAIAPIISSSDARKRTISMPNPRRTFEGANVSYWFVVARIVSVEFQGAPRAVTPIA